MRARRVLGGILRDERGSTIVLAAISMTALLSIVALAVDVGMIFTARSEAQRTADAAALAGAGSLIVAPDDADRARGVAVEYAAHNDVRGKTVVLAEEDVDVDLLQARVTVRARRVEENGGGVTTWFARIFGIDAVDIAADATAQAVPAGRAACVKPLTLFDRFDDQDGDGVYDPADGDQYDPFSHGYGSSWRNPGSPGDDGEGYYNDRGRQVVVKGGGTDAGPHDGTGGAGPSWYYPWDVPQTGSGECSGGGDGQGASCFQWALENCHPAMIEVGNEHWVSTGNMDGPTRTGISNLIQQDAGAQWDDSCHCVRGSKHGDKWEASERIGIIPTFDPSRDFDPGKKPIHFTNFVAVFFEKVEGSGTGQKVYARLLYPTGIAGGGQKAPMLRAVRLVE